MKNPDISIIIPCYNHGEYLHECIDSVLSYTGSLQLEIIIVNDGSTDGHTLDLLHLLEQNKNLKIIHQENKGLSAARNSGIQQAQADYFIPLDSDDILNPEFIDSAYSAAQNGADVVYGNVQLFGEKKELKITQWNSYTQMYGNGIHAFALVRKSMWKKVDGYDESMKIGYEDWEFWLNVYKHKAVFDKVELLSYYYRVKKQSMVTATIQKHSEILQYIHTKHHDLLMQQYIELNRKLHDAKNNRRLLLKHLIRNIFGKANE